VPAKRRLGSKWNWVLIELNRNVLAARRLPLLSIPAFPSFAQVAIEPATERFTHLSVETMTSPAFCRPARPSPSFHHKSRLRTEEIAVASTQDPLDGHCIAALVEGAAPRQLREAKPNQASRRE